MSNLFSDLLDSSMASSITISSSRPKKRHVEAEIDDYQVLRKKISLLKEKIQVDRLESIKVKLQTNRKNLEHQLSKVMTIVSINNSLLQAEEDIAQMLSFRVNQPLFKYNGFAKGSRKNGLVKIIKLPYIEKIPRYTFYAHLATSEIMAKDQAFSARRNVYYHKESGDALIYRDYDYEEVKEVKHEFSHGEDQIIWMAFEDHNITEKMLRIVKSCVGGTKSEIQERYKYLKEKDMNSEDSTESRSNNGICLDKSLNAAINSLDHLFCRRCLIFDCRLHGCHQPLFYPTEKQPIWNDPESKRKPCSDYCYLELKDANLSSTNKTRESLVDEVLATCNSKEITDKVEFMKLSNSMEEEDDELNIRSNWKPLEKELYLKGIEMFGKNSCLIFHNLLGGFKTCMEIGRYMDENEKSKEPSIDQKNKKASSSRRSKRKGKSKRLNYHSKTHITKEDDRFKHYTPCNCQGLCGKECSCALKGTSCEKYCGCGKECRNQFKGCQCVRAQCKSKHCPCFAASRECDPDLCANCWVSCGDDSMIEEGSSHEENNYPCENMHILSGKKPKILLGRSDVSGWGAFSKNPVKKDEYLGEYTGELISHSEADKRAEYYDILGYSYLFDLDNKHCIDAYRLGNKLKFANHSPTPNCYPKGMYVRGDYRVGIYAKKPIEAGAELFYNYNYNKNNQRAPKWFVDEDSNSNKKEAKNSHGKGKLGPRTNRFKKSV